MKQLSQEINYSKDITILFNKIKKILIDKIKKENSNYTYITINDLKNNAIRYLPTKMQSCAIALYHLVIHPKDEAFEYNMLLNIYKNLK